MWKHLLEVLSNKKMLSDINSMYSNKLKSERKEDAKIITSSSAGVSLMQLLNGTENGEIMRRHFRAKYAVDFSVLWHFSGTVVVHFPHHNFKIGIRHFFIAQRAALEMESWQSYILFKIHRKHNLKKGFMLNWKKGNQDDLRPMSSSCFTFLLAPK